MLGNWGWEYLYRFISWEQDSLRTLGFLSRSLSATLERMSCRSSCEEIRKSEPARVPYAVFPSRRLHQSNSDVRSLELTTPAVNPLVVETHREETHLSPLTLSLMPSTQ